MLNLDLGEIRERLDEECIHSRRKIGQKLKEM
jgi:hypothetical protein